jgi:hypothetical protein
MNIQVAFIYCFLTVLIIYLFLYLEQQVFCTNQKQKQIDNNKNLRVSVLCGLLNWIIIVYFIYQIETNIPLITSSAQTILQENF